MTVQTMSGNVAPPFRYCWTHFWSTSWSSNYAYHILFQSLGSQESRALNGAQFGVETKKLWSFEDKRAKLSGNFAGTIWKGVSQLRNHFLAHECHLQHNSPHFEAVKWASKSILGCEITFELENGYEMISKLRNGLQIAKLTCKNTLQSQWKLLKCQQSPATMHMKRRASRTLRSHTQSLSLHYWPP